MKRTLFFATILLFLGAFGLRADEVANGNGHIDVVEGSLAILNQKVPARLVIDFSNTRVVEFGKKDAVDKDCGPILEYLASKGEDYLADWEPMKKDLQAHCEGRFAKRNKMYIDNANAQYEVKIAVDQLDFGDTTARVFLSFHEEGGVVFSGKVIITDLSNGETLSVVNVVWMKGKDTNSYNYSQAHAVCFTFGNTFLDKFLFRKANKEK